jgi:hypothetical protein
MTNYSKEGLAVAVIDTIINRSLTPLSRNVLVVKYGYVNTWGDFQFPHPFIGTIEYDDNSNLDYVLRAFCHSRIFSCGLAIIEDSIRVKAFKDSLTIKAFGYINTEGEIIDSCQYLNAKPYSENVAAVQKIYDGKNSAGFGKWGFINISGTEISQFKYSALESPLYGRAIAQISYATPLSKIINENSKDEVDSTIRDDNEYEFSTFLVDGKGNIIKQLSLAYQYSTFSKDGFACCIPNNIGAYFGVGSTFLKRDGNFSKIKEFKDLTKAEQDKILNDPLGLGILPINIVFGNVTGFSNGYTSVEVGKDMWVYIDKWYVVKGHKNEEIYQAAFPFKNGLAAVKKKGKWGYIDTNFNVVIKLEYDSCGYAGRNLCKVYTSQHDDGVKIMSYINRKGDIVWQNIDVEDVSNIKNKDKSMYGKWQTNIEYRYKNHYDYKWFFILLIALAVFVLIIIYDRHLKKSGIKDRNKTMDFTDTHASVIDNKNGESIKSKVDEWMNSNIKGDETT